VAGPGCRPAGGRRQLARSLTDFRNLSITDVNLEYGWQNAAHAGHPNQRRRGSAGGQPQHAAQLGAPLRLSGAEAHARQPPQLRAGRAADAARRARRDRQHLAAFEAFDEEAADRAVEESLALRPLERTVEELLLPAVDELAADPDREAELEFASRWATGWLHGARRLASTASRPAGILLLDASRGSDAEAVHAQALDLALRRAGFRVLMLSDELGEERMERALRALDPTAIVLCGPGADTPSAVQLVRKIREAGFDAPLFGFRARGLIGDAVPSAGERPSEVTGMLNADLRRRATQAFA
jgi:hypothetical protein